MIVMREDGRGMIEMQGDCDGRESYVRMVFQVAPEHVQAVAVEVLQSGTVTIYMRDRVGAIHEAIRGWADDVVTLEDRAVVGGLYQRAPYGQVTELRETNDGTEVVLRLSKEGALPREGDWLAGRPVMRELFATLAKAAL